MRSLIRNTLFGVTLSVTAASTMALPITFDFTGSSKRLDRSTTFSSNGLDVQATAGGWFPSLTQNASGLGVASFFDSSWQLDGSGVKKESINFNFSRSVRLLGFTLTNVDRNDEYTLSANDVRQIAGDIPGTGTSVVDLGSQSGLFGTDFGFGVTDWTDDYFINSLTVDSADVPEPGTIALFAVGLVGLGIARRRAKN